MRMHSRAQVVVLLCSLLAGAANAEPDPEPTYKDCHPGDKAALLAVKAAFGEAYDFASWKPDNPCCDWYDVARRPSPGHVVGLAIFQDANLTGTIPTALAGLPHLEDLTLRHLPGLSGPIPPAIGKLSNLSSLRISWTAVSGPVPSFLGALKKLNFLDLSFNSLSGAIPASLGTIPLSGINLSRNRLTGARTIPLSGLAQAWCSRSGSTSPM
uniref:Leucine-rich repeat-containing N-terminal plant-type domain-containing protein n=1 Tax=Triticum urartu TaxID=4572 RepID=A0A8R7VJG1_TRIUA